MRLGQAITAGETALPTWGKPKPPGKNGNDPKSSGQLTGMAAIEAAQRNLENGNGKNNTQ
jgi:hypothetical protein